MQKLEVVQNSQFICGKCKKKASVCYTISRNSFDISMYNIQKDIMDRILSTTEFMCESCYQGKILSLIFVQKLIDNQQKEIEQLKLEVSTLIQKNQELQIQEQEKLKMIEIGEQKDQDIQGQVKSLEQILEKGNQVFSQVDHDNGEQMNSGQYKEFIKKSNQDYGKKLLSFTKDQITKSQKNIKKIQSFYQNIANNLQKLVSGKHINLNNIQKSIESDIQNQKVEEKQKYIVDLEQFIQLFEELHQSTDAQETVSKTIQ